MCCVNRFNGVVRLSEKAPDTITSYMISAFAIDDLNGLGVTKQPSKVSLFICLFTLMSVPQKSIEGVAMEVGFSSTYSKLYQSRIPFCSPLMCRSLLDL